MSDTTIEQPAPPATKSASETSREAIQAQIDALPEILRAQREFGPEFNQTTLDALREFGPQFAQSSLDIQKLISPELTSASQTLQDFLRGDDEQEFSRLLPGLQRDVRAAQSQRGLGDISPLGSIEEASQIQQLRQNLKNRRLNTALSVAGRQPVSGIPTTSGAGQLVQNVNPDSIFARQNAIDSFNLGLYGQQSQNFANQPGSVTGQIIGAVGGGLLGSITGGAGTSIGSSIGNKFGSLIG